jgi:hypothetical protein
MVGSNKDQGWSRRLFTEDQEWSSIGRVLDGQTIKRSGVAVCGLHRAQGDEEIRFLGASKPRSTVSLNLTSKLVATFLMVWPRNHSLGFSSLGLKTGSCSLVIWPIKSQRQFLGMGFKTKWEEVCQFVPQNQ